MRADVRRSAARVLVDGVDAEVSRCAERARVERIASEMHVGDGCRICRDQIVIVNELDGVRYEQSVTCHVCGRTIAPTLLIRLELEEVPVA